MRVAGAGILKPLCPMVMADVATFVRMVRSKTEDMIENMVRVGWYSLFVRVVFGRGTSGNSGISRRGG
jgi:hypothetical protein